MSLPGVFVAGKISQLSDLAAKWQAGYPLTRTEFEEVCRQREDELKAFKEYIDKVAQIIAKLGKMLKKAFADLVAADNALQLAKAKLLAAKPGTPEESAAQAEVARCEAAYNDAKSRYKEIDADKKKKEAFKGELDKEYAQWKDALDDFRRRGEARLRELEIQGRNFQKQNDNVIALVREGLSRGA